MNIIEIKVIEKTSSARRPTAAENTRWYFCLLMHERKDGYNSLKVVASLGREFLPLWRETPVRHRGGIFAFL
jgi:hypothetical protein